MPELAINRRRPGPLGAVPGVAARRRRGRRRRRGGGPERPMGRVPEPGRNGRGVRGSVRRLPGRSARRPDGERHRHDGGGAARRSASAGATRSIIPALTFAATAYAPIAAGALPSSSTSRPTRGRSIPTWSRRAITPRPRAIMPVHLGHQMADMDRIMAIARSHGARRGRGLRARARTAAGSDQGAGCIGDFGSFSHQSSKILTVGRRRLAADERRRPRPAWPTRSSTAGARRTPTRRSTRSAPTTAWASLHAALLVGRHASGSPRSRRSAPSVRRTRGAGRRRSRASA